MSLTAAYQQFHDEIKAFIPQKRIVTDPVRTLAYGTDAGFYRLIPKLVVKVRTPEEVTDLLKIAHRLRLPVTFRAAGTSLSGQAISDSILVVLAGGWSKYAVIENGEKIRLQPGVIGSDANIYLKPFARKIGPDPASINSAMIGGIAANNASGMCCGTSDNSYKTVVDMKLIFEDGTVLDTASEQSREQFRQTHAELIAEIAAIRDEILANPELKEQIAHKFKIKNTTGYGLNSFIDFYDPFDIISHLMIGSEGTLGFISEITYRTVVEHEHKASALIIYPDMKQACTAVMRLSRPLVAAAELVDRIGLRSVEDKAGMPDYLKTLDEEVTAVLVEIRTEDKAALTENMHQVQSMLEGIPTVLPLEFTAVKAEYEKLWNIRKGLFPSVGNVREKGTTVIIEDVAFPLESLAEAVLELRAILNKHGYHESVIFGHALDGNVHFVFTQDFAIKSEVDRYHALMLDITAMVINQFGGSLKAEHGTGRNMAPFVEAEWGKHAYQMMLRLKKAFDPYTLLNPDVIITENANIYLENFKPLPIANDIIDKCIECGFCEPQCPSRNLTATPRQRIVVQREIARLKKTGEDPRRLAVFEKEYEYFGDETCATDGLCATACPVSINTGDHTKEYRAERLTPKAHNVAKFITRNFSGVTSAAKLGLTGASAAHAILGTRLMTMLTKGARELSGNKIPLWNPWLPKAGSTPEPVRTKAGDGSRKVVYFPSCVSRTMGAACGDKDHRPLNQPILSLLEKAGYTVILPPDLDKLCCGMPFESKGFFAEADQMSTQLEQVLLACSNDGEYPVLSDTSPCTYRMHRVFGKKLKLYDTVEFIHDYLLERLEVSRLPETVAVHVTCSSVKMGMTDKFRKVAEACAAKVVMPERIKCCGFAGDKGFEVPELNESALEGLKQALPPDCTAGYSNSRTCEIGLSNSSGISYQSIAYLVDRCTVAKKV